MRRELERGWSDDRGSARLDSDLADTVEVDRSGPGRVGCLARVPEEGLARAGRLDYQQAGVAGGHHQRVDTAPRCERKPTGANHMLAAVDVEQDLALEDEQGLVHIGVKVHRRNLAALEDVFEDDHGVSRLLCERLPRMDPAAEEPHSLTFTLVPHDRLCYRFFRLCHRFFLSL